MRADQWTIPNTLSSIRLFLVPVLWALAIAGESKAVGLGLVVAAITDVLDGQLARRLNQISAFGSKLDSLADLCVNFSSVGWLLVLKPQVIWHHPLFFSSVTLAGVFSLWLGWMKFGRLADFHLHSGRVAGVAGYLFLIDLFVFGHYARPLFVAVMVLAWVVAVEALVIILTRDNLDERVPSPILGYISHGHRLGRRGRSLP